MYRHILVPLDGSHLSEQVLPHAKALAEIDKATTQITVLRAVPPIYPAAVEFGSVYTTTELNDETARIEVAACEYLNRIADALQVEGFKVNVHMSRMEPAEAIIDYTETSDIDLIAIATHGRSGIGRWMFGSVTQKVMQAAPVPMLVIRPKE
ncbi:MAG: universal stress protein [Chloroflexaceae bacterium]|nr:universal stress protein [Chloroflexaceae bacterium]NJL35236.1 universal stress protein [Chloroflexaceae bacterium]NJO82778.1 universal stress protein [Blastochloris sp.]